MEPTAGAAAAPIAALPMYDFETLHHFNDELWAAVAQRLVRHGVQGIPSRLTRDLALHDIWRHEQLLLAQTCGYPLYSDLRESVRVVATPKYSVPGCRGVFHRSFIVARADDAGERLEDFRGRHGVVNSYDSNSGANLFRLSIAPLARNSRFFAEISVTGSHYESLERVVNKTADMAAIDCVTYAHLQSLSPALVRCTKIIERTSESPGLPFITAASTSPAVVLALQTALREIEIDDALAPIRQALFLEGFEFVSQEEYYRQIGAIEKGALAQGYAHMA
jgi:ABC-type phosphate/phosphonate transport system substrate-binding protein